MELAREQAFIKHSHYVMLTNPQGHVQGMSDKEWGFSTCPHPDCVLVRADAAASRATSQPDAAQLWHDDFCARVLKQMQEDGDLLTSEETADIMETVQREMLEEDRLAAGARTPQQDKLEYLERLGQPICCVEGGGCGEKIHDPSAVYRCADCTQPFHRKCLRNHFVVQPRGELHPVALAAGARAVPSAKCADCGDPLNEGEAKCFTVCDACWEKVYPRRAVPSDIDNGNIYVFCDFVGVPFPLREARQASGCIRGAGHDGPHAFSLGAKMLMPIVLRSACAVPETPLEKANEKVLVSGEGRAANNQEQRQPKVLRELRNVDDDQPSAGLITECCGPVDRGARSLLPAMWSRMPYPPRSQRPD